MRQSPSQPSIQPHAKEGRLVMPLSHVFEVTGTSSKEGAMQAIGTALNRRSKEAGAGQETSRGPAKGDRRRRAQRKSFKHRKCPQRKRSSVGSEDLFNMKRGLDLRPSSDSGPSRDETWMVRGAFKGLMNHSRSFLVRKSGEELNGRCGRWWHHFRDL